MRGSKNLQIHFSIVNLQKTVRLRLKAHTAAHRKQDSMMKEYTFKIISAAILCLALASCSKYEGGWGGGYGNGSWQGPTEPVNAIIGTWSATLHDGNEETTVTWTFNANDSAVKRVTVSLGSNTISDDSSEYSYELEDDTLILISKGTVVATYHVEISGNNMRMGNEESGYLDYTKEFQAIPLDFME